MTTYLFLDIECTGLDAHYHEIIELSAIRTNIDMTEELARFDMLIKPKEEIPHFITNLTGITNEMVADAKSIDEVRELFHVFIEPTDIIVGHNIQFDTGFLKANTFAIDHLELDTYPLSQFFLKDQESHSLEVLTKNLDIEHSNAHRAMADVEANLDLMKIIRDNAQKTDQNLLQKWQPIFAKSEWKGAEPFFDELFNLPLTKGNEGVSQQNDNQQSKDNIIDAQASLFEEASTEAIEISKTKQERSTSPSLRGTEGELTQEIDNLTPLEHSISETIQNTAQTSLLNIEAEADHILAAQVAKADIIATPRAYKYQTPAGYTRWAPKHQCFSENTLNTWLSNTSALSEAETIVIMKCLQWIEDGHSNIIRDLPLQREEWQIVPKWSGTESEKYVIKPTEKIFCDIDALPFLQGDHVVIGNAQSFASSLEGNLSQAIYGRQLEQALKKWEEDVFRSRELELSTTENDASSLIEGLFFGLGMLKNTLRTLQAGGAFIKQNWDKSLSETKEFQNLLAGFVAAHKQIAQQHPSQSFLLDQLQNIITFLQTPDEANITKWFELDNKDNIQCKATPTYLKPHWEKITNNFTKVILIGHRLQKVNGSYQLGEDLPVVNPQISLKDSTTYTEKASLYLVNAGGNTRQSTAQETSQMAIDYLQQTTSSENILVVLPSYPLAQSTLEILENQLSSGGHVTSAADDDWNIVLANGSSGKINQKITSKKTIVITAHSQINRIDFDKAQFGGCILHRLIFLPNKTPAQAIRNASKNEFPEIALPTAVQQFLFLFDKLAASSPKFWWAVLDAHFQKKSPHFTDEFLKQLPVFPIKRCSIEEMIEGVIKN